MKKIFLVLITFTLFLKTEYILANDLIKEGTYGIGGSGSISVNHIENNNLIYNLTSFVFQPNILYFFSKGLALGSVIEYNWVKSNGLYNYKSKYWGFGPQIRYYFLQNQYNPFIYINYQYQSDFLKSDGNNNTLKSNKFSIGLGLDLFIIKNVAIEPSLEYYKYQSDNDYKSEGVELNVGLNIFIL